MLKLGSQPMDSTLFLVVSYGSHTVRIAGRGKCGTLKARSCISLEPGFER